MCDHFFTESESLVDLERRENDGGARRRTMRRGVNQSWGFRSCRRCHLSTAVSVGSPRGGRQEELQQQRQQFPDGGVPASCGGGEIQEDAHQLAALAPLDRLFHDLVTSGYARPAARRGRRGGAEAVGGGAGRALSGAGWAGSSASAALPLAAAAEPFGRRRRGVSKFGAGKTDDDAGGGIFATLFGGGGEAVGAAAGRAARRRLGRGAARGVPRRRLPPRRRGHGQDVRHGPVLRHAARRHAQAARALQQVHARRAHAPAQAAHHFQRRRRQRIRSRRGWGERATTRWKW